MPDDFEHLSGAAIKAVLREETTAGKRVVGPPSKGTAMKAPGGRRAVEGPKSQLGSL